jgi:NADH:ubiquinone oxidoreductase subunit 5 (subunit L)/multisubunit Na+/H+ antiporter MnhA subunit
MSLIPNIEQLEQFFGSITVIAPALLIPILGISSVLNFKVSEKTTDRFIRVFIAIGLISLCGVLAIMLISDKRYIPIDFGRWVHLEEGGTVVGNDHAEHYSFAIKVVYDRLSIPLAMLSFVLCGTIGAFASKYMHREPGYHRFFFLYVIFTVGMVLASLAGTIETLFIGWELVGLSSALLVGFFHERPSPVRNGLHIWIIYRISDASLLLAAIVMHKMSGHGDLHELLGINDSWPGEIPTSVTELQAALVGGLLLFAAAGKSGLVPFSGWLPRAMEGPTPSSAIYYGALSVHLGAFMLLRTSPLLALSPVLCGVIVAIGLITAIFATLASRVQGDIKSSLAYASLTQVAIVVMEIGLGLRYLALVHLLGNACYRTLQFVRAPNVMRDHKQLVNSLGDSFSQPSSAFVKSIPDNTRRWLFRWSFERGYLDAILKDYIVVPFISLFNFFERIENRWTDILSGKPQKPAEIKLQQSQLDVP